MLTLLSTARAPETQPLLWSLIGFGAALSLGIREDFGLLVAGALGTVLLIWRDRRAALPPAYNDTVSRHPVAGA